LKSFGIPIELLPTNVETNTKDALKNHRKWCQMRKAKEQLSIESPGTDCESFIVECPQHEDCLFGKGQAIMKHPGNVAMRKLLETRQDRWEAAAFKDKSGLTWEVVHEIMRGGGRFLREDSNGWFVEVEDEVARSKVSIAFRDMVKRTRQRRKKEADKQQGAQQPPQQQESKEPKPEYFEPHRGSESSLFTVETIQSRNHLNGGSNNNNHIDMSYEFLGQSEDRIVNFKRRKLMGGDAQERMCWGGRNDVSSEDMMVCWGKNIM
jgi:hypothetical protein